MERRTPEDDARDALAWFIGESEITLEAVLERLEHILRLGEGILDEKVLDPYHASASRVVRRLYDRCAFGWTTCTA